MLRWLRIGVAAAGAGVALVAAPGTAVADPDADSSGVRSSQGAGPAAASSASVDGGSASGDTNDSSGDALAGPGQDTSASAADDAPEGALVDSGADESDGADALSSEPDPATGSASSEQSTELASASADPIVTASEDDSADARTASSGSGSDATEGHAVLSGGGHQGTPAATTDETTDSSEDDAVAPTAEPAALDSPGGQTVTADTVTTPAASSVVFAQSAVSSPVAVTHSTHQPEYPASVNAPVTWRSILTEGLSWLGLAALAPNLPAPQFPVPELIAGLWIGMRKAQYTFFNSAPRLEPAGYTAEQLLTPPADPSPSVYVHNNSDQTIWVYNLPDSGNYSIDADFQPISIPAGSSAPVGLVVGTGALGTPENRIYIVEGDTGFALPVDSSSGIDAFNPTAVTAGNSFLNYNFLEYFLYQADGSYQYTVDTSYIDEWSLPIQFRFTIPNGTDWTGAKSGTTYGFKDYDTVVSQLTAAGGPYQDLVWSGGTPWTPQPPSTVSRIIGPDKVWTAQSLQPPSNFNMNNVGWVPTSYQDFVQHGAESQPPPKPTIYPYAYNGNEYSATQNNFDFWRYEVTAPAGTPYPIALRTAAKLDGYPAVDGVWGFFTYPNDETAGQFTNIPNTVSLDIYVHGSSDGVSDSVVEGGKWLYSSSPTRSDAGLLKPGRNMLLGSDATDTFILDSVYKGGRNTPLVIAQGQEHDIIAIDKTSLAGALSNDVDIVDCFWFLGGGFANYDSQFIYDRSSGYLYYDQYPDRFGYTGVLANLSLSQIDPAHAVFVL